MWVLALASAWPRPCLPLSPLSPQLENRSHAIGQVYHGDKICGHYHRWESFQSCWKALSQPGLARAIAAFPQRPAPLWRGHSEHKCAELDKEWGWTILPVEKHCMNRFGSLLAKKRTVSVTVTPSLAGDALLFLPFCFTSFWGTLHFNSR